MSVLQKFLKKIGVQSYEELNDEEKSTFKTWEESLQGRQITQDEYRQFLENELTLAVDRLTEVNLSKEDEVFRKVEVRLIKKVLNFMDMPLLEKKIVEKQIESRM